MRQLAMDLELFPQLLPSYHIMASKPEPQMAGIRCTYGDCQHLGRLRRGSHIVNGMGKRGFKCMCMR